MRLIAPSIGNRIWQLVAIASGAIVAFSVLVYINVGRTKEARDWVEHTETVLDELNAYAEHVADAETAQRGYLLTLGDDFLLPYKAANANRQEHRDRLLRLTSDNPAQRPRLEKLERIIDEKFEGMAHSIELAQSGRVKEAIAGVREGHGRVLMEQFQKVRAEIADTERKLLAERRQRLEDGNTLSIRLVIAGTLSIILTLLLVAKHTISRIDRPVRNLMTAIGALSRGSFTSRAEVSSQDEIGRVAAAFNTMADHLQDAKAAREEALYKLEIFAADLVRTNKDLDSFAYIASHDLKSPLRAIRSLADWIAEDVGKGSIEGETLENLRLLRSRVERLDTLLEGLLQYSRAGRTETPVEEVDTGRLIGEIAALYSLHPASGVVCDGEMPVLITNRAPLELVLRNLIDNGFKHRDGGTCMVVVTGRVLDDERVEFRVKDNGPGIDPAYHDKIFGVFQTLQSRDKVEGSGIGLAIVRKTVESHGGTIRVESAPPERGTTFIFTWAKRKPNIAPAPDWGISHEPPNSA